MLSDDRRVGIGIDLRERMAVERSYRESEASLKLALDFMELGTFECDLRIDAVTCPELMRALYGVGPETPMAVDTNWKAVPADDEVLLRAVVAGAIAHGPGREVASRCSAEHRVKGIEDGVERQIAKWGRVLFDDNGRPNCSTRVNLDITARKQTERALAESRHRQELRIEIVRRLLSTPDT